METKIFKLSEEERTKLKLENELRYLLIKKNNEERILEQRKNFDMKAFKLKHGLIDKFFNVL